MKMSCLTVLEAVNQRSRYWRGWYLLTVLRGNVFHVSPLASGGFLVILGIPQPVETSLVAQLVENPPTMWENWVWSLAWEDLLEKGTATYPFQYSGLENSTDMESQRVRHDWMTFTFAFLTCRSIILISASIFTCFSPCVCVCSQISLANVWILNVQLPGWWNHKFLCFKPHLMAGFPGGASG